MRMLLVLIAKFRIFVIAITGGVAVWAAALPESRAQDLGAPPEPEIFDLGERVQGETYSFNLAAENSSCESPQDFRFELDNMPWMHFVAGDTVRKVGFGQQGSLPVTLDFTSTQPGPYEGQISIYCETCGFFVFGSNCRINNRQMQVRVQVAPAQQQPQQAQADQQPAPPVQQAAPQQVEISPAAYDPPDVPNINEGLRTDLRPGQVRGIDRARDKAARAIAAAGAAVDALNAQRKKCQDCWDEVARLEAEAKAKQDAADQAQAGADQAKAEADAAEQAAKDAEQHSKNFNKELKAAERKMNSTYKTLQMQAAARTYAGRDFGAGSEQYAHADEQVDKANDAAVEAQREYSRLKATKEARKEAAEKARAEANAKKKTADDSQKAADDAQTAADDAKKAAEKKRKECENLDNACQKAADDADAAAAAAAAEVKKAQDKVDKANALLAANLEEDLKNKRKAHNDCIEKLKKIARRNLKLQQILRDIGRVKDSEVPPPDLDVEQTVAMWVATSVADNVAAYAPVPTFEVFTILDTLEALYGLIRIQQSLLTPSAQGYRGDDNLAKHLIEHGHADSPKEARELVEAVKTYMKNRRANPDYLKKEWEYQVALCKKLAEEIKALEAKLAAAK